MHRAKRVLAGLAGAICATATFSTMAEGLIADPENLTWSRWQGRLALGTGTPPWQANLGGSVSTGLKINSISLLGDYYFSRPIFGADNTGGFRTTTGFFHGPRGQFALGDTSISAQGNAFSIGRRWLSSGGVHAVDVSADSATVPYLGIGYTGLSLRSGWRFNADLGLMALDPGQIVKFGRVVSGSQPLDEMLREMRLAPIVQFGVSYAF
jgi:hypothetical protein